MTLDQLTTSACHKAMESCVSQLRELGWASDEIKDHVDTLIPMLRAEGKAVLDDAVREFTEAMQSGARHYAPVLFNLEFVLAGNRVARQFDAEFKANTREHFERMAILADHADAF